METTELEKETQDAARPAVRSQGLRIPAWCRVWLKRVGWTAFVLAGGSYLKDLIFRAALTSALTGMLGAPVTIRSASLGLLRPGALIRQLEAAQPKGFPEGRLAQIREIRVRVDVPALLRGQLHVPDLVLRVHEVHVIRDAQKRINVDSLNVIEAAKQEAAASKSPVALPKFKIDRATLSVDRVVYSDYTKGTPPKVQVFDRVVREKSFENVTSVNQLAVAVFSHALGPTALKSAGIAGMATLASVGLVPVGILAVAVAKDSAAQVFMLDWNRTFAATAAFLRENGELKSADKTKGTLEAKVQDCRVLVSLKKVSGRMTEVTLSARKFLLPKPQVAAGLLYRLDQRIDD